MPCPKNAVSSGTDKSAGCMKSMSVVVYEGLTLWSDVLMEAAIRVMMQKKSLGFCRLERQKNMYEIDDYVICKNKGVCRVADIKPVSSNGIPEEKQQYILFWVSNPADPFFVPLDKDAEILRKVLTKEEALELLDRILYIRTIQAPNDKILNEFYMQAMDKYDALEWIKVIKTVYIRKKERRMTDTQIAYDAAAKKYLHEELSVVLGIPYGDVEEYIKQYVANSL